MGEERLVIENFTINILLTIDIGENINLEVLKEKLKESDTFSEVIRDIVEGRLYDPLYYEELEYPLKIVHKEMSINVNSSFWKSKVLLIDDKIPGPPLYTRIYEKGILNALNGLKISPLIKIYPNGIAILIIPLKISGCFEADDIIGLINPLIYQDVPLIISENNKISLRNLALSVRNIILDKYPEIQQRVKEPINEKVDEYTIIQVHKFKNAETGYELFEKFYTDFKGLLIRAIKHYRDIHSVEGLKNQALEESSIFNVSYKSTFLYLPLFKQELIYEIYYRPIELLRAQHYLLQIYDVLLAEAIGKVSTLHREKYEKIRKEILELEELKKEILDGLEGFRTFTPSSYRARYVFDTAEDMFKTTELYNKVKAKKEDLDTILSKAYDILEREKAKRMTTAMNILSTIFAGALSFSLAPSLIRLLNHYQINTPGYLEFPLSIAFWIVISIIALVYIRLTMK